MDIDDRLELRVVGARDLPEAEGGECNPFAAVRCGRESETTNVANGTVNEKPSLTCRVCNSYESW